MKYSKYPQDMQDYICKLRRQGVPASQVKFEVNCKFPDYPSISVGGIYHVERRRKGIHRPSRTVERQETQITLCGPAWAIPDLPNIRRHAA